MLRIRHVEVIHKHIWIWQGYCALRTNQYIICTLQEAAEDQEQTNCYVYININCWCRRHASPHQQPARSCCKPLSNFSLFRLHKNWCECSGHQCRHRNRCNCECEKVSASLSWEISMEINCNYSQPTFATLSVKRCQHHVCKKSNFRPSINIQEAPCRDTGHNYRSIIMKMQTCAIR